MLFACIQKARGTAIMIDVTSYSSTMAAAPPGGAKTTASITMSSTSTSTRKNSKERNKMIDSSVALPNDFFPSSLDVICGKGKEYYAHPGNVEFRQLINKALPQYAQAETKHDKGVIVMAVVDAVRQQSPLGGFVRCDVKFNTWYEIGDEAAREKAGQSIRDALLDLDPSKKKERLQKRAANKAKRSKARRSILAKQQQEQEKSITQKCLIQEAVPCCSSSLLQASQTAACTSLDELPSTLQRRQRQLLLDLAGRQEHLKMSNQFYLSQIENMGSSSLLQLSQQQPATIYPSLLELRSRIQRQRLDLLLLRHKNTYPPYGALLVLAPAPASYWINRGRTEYVGYPTMFSPVSLAHLQPP